MAYGISLLGEGGVGVVWRAEDTRLGRDVTLKVHPDRLAGDSQRLVHYQQVAYAEKG